MINQFNQGYKYEIYVGLKDRDSYEEILSVDDFKNILSELCVSENICFTLVNQFGGYTHNKGYTTETSLRVVIIGAEEQMILRLSNVLKERINTDTVLISKQELEYAFIK